MNECHFFLSCTRSSTRTIQQTYSIHAFSLHVDLLFKSVSSNWKWYIALSIWMQFLVSCMPLWIITLIVYCCYFILSFHFIFVFFFFFPFLSISLLFSLISLPNRWTQRHTFIIVPKRVETCISRTKSLYSTQIYIAGGLGFAQINLKNHIAISWIQSIWMNDNENVLMKWTLQQMDANHNEESEIFSLSHSFVWVIFAIL